MNQSSQRGSMSIITLGIAIAAILGGALLIGTHEPGNPPLSFIQKDGEKKLNGESAPEGFSAVPYGTGKSTARSIVPKPAEKSTSGVAQEKRAPAQNISPSQRWFASPPQRNCVSNPNPQFTHAFTDISLIDALNPIGGIGGGSPGRSYIGVQKGKEAPVYAPADAVMRTIVYIDRGEGYGEYGIFLRVSCEVEILFDHIDKVSDRLLKYAPKEAARSSAIQGKEELNLPIQAGELLGYTNGTSLARTFDFLVTNYGRKNSFINPKRWEWDQALYGTCPYDYFIPALKSQYYEKLGKPTMGVIVKAASCGNPSHDSAGTLSGGWFKGDSTDERGEYLAIAREYDDVRIVLRKDGLLFPSQQDVVRGKNAYFNFTDMSPDAYPADVTPGKSVCYSGNGEWAFIKLASATELLFATGSGECPSTFPESQAGAWVR